MPRTSTIDTHPQRAKINAALVKGTAHRAIADRFGLSKTAVTRHLEEKLRERAAATQKALAIQDGEYLMEELERSRVMLTKMAEACDRWLTDPTDPTRYSMDITHPDDVIVAYDTPTDEDGKGGKTVKVRLSELLPMLEDPDLRRDVRMVELRRKDIRELLLRSRAEIRADLDLLATIQGKIKQTVNITYNTPVVLQMVQVMNLTLRGHPEARDKLTQAWAKMTERMEAE